MEDKDKIKQRFELLKMARELLNEDYINRRAEDHNKWVADNDESWRTTRRNIPYPPFAQYTTDEEIVRAAANLYNFIYNTDSYAPVQSVITASAVEEPAPAPAPAPQQGDFVFPQTGNAHKPSLEILHQDAAVEIVSLPCVELGTGEMELTTVEADKEISTLNKETHTPTIEEIKEVSARIAATRHLLPGWIRRTVT